MSVHVNQLHTVQRTIIGITGYLPVRLDVKSDYSAQCAGKCTGQRVPQINGVPTFIDNGLTTGHLKYYKPTAPNTAVDYTF